MHARGIPPPPGFEGVASPVRVPAGAGRQALPLQVPALASAAPALLHHVHQPSYLPHTHAQIPVRPPMTMHDAVRALSDRTRAYLRADRKTERVCARTCFGRQRLTHYSAPSSCLLLSLCLRAYDSLSVRALAARARALLPASPSRSAADAPGTGWLLLRPPTPPRDDDVRPPRVPVRSGPAAGVRARARGRTPRGGGECRQRGRRCYRSADDEKFGAPNGGGARSSMRGCSSSSSTDHDISAAGGRRASADRRHARLKPISSRALPPAQVSLPGICRAWPPAK